MMKQLITGLFFVAIALNSQAQLVVKPLNYNPAIQKYLADHPDYEWGQSQKLSKWGSKDTLQLPFFEEFLEDHIYPDSSRWLNNMVYINRSLALRPPTYGVATFDHLDEKGNPYNALHNTDIVYADTLTSQSIDLTDIEGYSVTPADSVYMSFYFQPKGRGQEITSNDELRLQFLDKDTNWNEVWRTRGSNQVEFEQILIPITDPDYFHKGFQFRFYNVTHRWGNNNHWHVDYIRIDTNRFANDIYTRDVAFQSEPASLLKNYSSMPYSHFLADVSGEMQSTTLIRVSNRSDLDKQVSIKFTDRHKGTIIGQRDNFSNISNCSSYDDSERIVDMYNFSTLNGDSIVIERTFICKEDSQESFIPFRENDTVVSKQIFDNYYARDDGTAEAGFGFDNLIGREGSIAVAFDLKKRDTLQGFAFHYTQINHDVSDKRFTLKVWRSIEVDGVEDSLIYELLLFGPEYSNQMNGYTFYRLDQPIVLNPGKFYIGWTQDVDFSLNVGLDQNHGRIIGRGQGANPDIYFNIGTGWIKNTNNLLYGSPMIRAYVGSFRDPTASVRKQEKNRVTVYPNPTQNQIYFEGLEVEQAMIYDLTGRVLLQSEVKNNKMDLSGLRNGRYLLRWTGNSSRSGGTAWVTVVR